MQYGIAFVDTVHCCLQATISRPGFLELSRFQALKLASRVSSTFTASVEFFVLQKDHETSRQQPQYLTSFFYCDFLSSRVQFWLVAPMQLP